MLSLPPFQSPEGRSSTLLCLDLDDVLMTVAERTGSEAWESGLARKLQVGKQHSSSPQMSQPANTSTYHIWSCAGWCRRKARAPCLRSRQGASQVRCGGL